MAMKKPTIDYDKEADVLYVSFGIDEPSYCESLNSFVLLELGAFTRQPTGFRVIQPRKRDIKKMTVKVGKIIQRRIKTVEKELQDREEVVKNAIKQIGQMKELAKVG